MFQNCKDFTPMMAPFTLRVYGPSWFTKDFPALSLEDEEELNQIWQAYLTPTLLSSRISATKSSTSYTIQGYQPNLVARQFGLCQIRPRSLHAKKKDLRQPTTAQEYWSRLESAAQNAPAFIPLEFEVCNACTVPFLKWWEHYYKPRMTEVKGSSLLQQLLSACPVTQIKKKKKAKEQEEKKPVSRKRPTSSPTEPIPKKAKKAMASLIPSDDSEADGSPTLRQKKKVVSKENPEDLISEHSRIEGGATEAPSTVLMESPQTPPVLHTQDTLLPSPVSVSTLAPSLSNPTEFQPREGRDEIMVGRGMSAQEEESLPKDDTSTGILLSSGTNLSAQEWEELKKNNPAEALEARLGSKTPSGSKTSVSTHSAGITATATSMEALLQALRTQVLEGDLFQTIEVNPPFAIQVKDLLQKLAELDVEGALDESVSDFVIAAQPLFDQLTINIQKKKEHDRLLQLEMERKGEKAALVETTHANFASLKARSNADLKAIEDCEAEIKVHEESIALLRSKIQELEKKKEALMQSSTPAEQIQNQIDREATICLTHLEELEHCTALVDKLSKDGNFLDRKISKAKALFNSLKSKVTL